MFSRDVLAIHTGNTTIDDDWITGILATTGNVLADTGWRVEVHKKGRYYGWRQGSGTRRKYQYGGTFEALAQADPQRAAAYTKRAARAGFANITAEPS